MGVTVYVADGCPFCVHAKQLLDKKDVQYTVVNISKKPEKAQEMFLTTGKRTVPQIFIDDEHIGGLEALRELDEQGILDARVAKYVMEDEELKFQKKKRKKKMKKITLGDKNMKEADIQDIQLLKIFDELIGRNGVPRQYRGLKFKYKTFKGCELVTWIQVNKDKTLNEAVELADKLHKSGYFESVKSKDQRPFENSKTLYRFFCEKNTNLLNAERNFKDKARPAPELAKILQQKVLKMSDWYITEDGRGVDYKACAKSQIFLEYRVIVNELQTVNLKKLTTQEAVAFWLNLYNALIIHANIIIGPPSNFMQRAKFFGSVSYLISGERYSLSFIEHAILRGNRKPPGAFSKLISKKDQRAAYVCNLDPRIHFALVCGAKSCPPIRVYEPENLDLSLQWATEGFCADEIQIDRRTNTITLSMIFRWYAPDFGRKPANVLHWIVNYLPPDNKLALIQMLVEGNYKIKYSRYNWDTNNRYGVEEERIILNKLNQDDEPGSLTCTSDGCFVTPRRTPNSFDGGSSDSDYYSDSEARNATWWIDFTEIEMFEIIGKGGFGEVYRGSYHGREIAIKLITNAGELTNSQLKDFYLEVNTMKNLKHPNVVEFIGASLTPSGCIVTEFVPNGNLRSILQSKRLTWFQSVSMLLDAGKGVQYLHSLDPPIVHRDLKSYNLLVDQNYSVKVADFGLSKSLKNVDTHNSRIGTLNWIAPELLNGDTKCSTSADSFSFAMIMWEVATGDVPFKEKSPLQIVKALDAGARPPVPKDMPDDYIELMTDCWQQDPNRRPNFDEIVQRLTGLLQSSKLATGKSRVKFAATPTTSRGNSKLETDRATTSDTSTLQRARIILNKSVPINAPLTLERLPSSPH